MSNLVIDKKLQINAPIDRLFQFLTDPSKIPLVLPGLIENKNIPKLPLKMGSKFNYKYQMYGTILEGLWTVTEINSPDTYKAKTDGDAASAWSYKLIKKGSGTLVDIRIEYEVPKSVLSKIKVNIIKSINEKEVDHYLHNLKTVLEM